MHILLTLRPESRRAPPTVSADNFPDVDPGEWTDDAVFASDYVKPVSQKPRVVEVIDGEEEHVPNSPER